jgi:hypothetical protein
MFAKVYNASVEQYSKVVHKVEVDIPSEEGDYKLVARLNNPPKSVKVPVESYWPIRVCDVSLPEELKQVKIGVSPEDNELRNMFVSLGFSVVGFEEGDILVCGKESFDNIERSDNIFLSNLEKAVTNNKNILLLDVGPYFLGAGYPGERKGLGNLQGSESLSNVEENTYSLIKGVKFSFKTLPEAESNIQYAEYDSSLWYSLSKQSTWMWNGLRGGLIVPSVDMSFSGLNPDSFIKKWESRGAKKSDITSQSFYGYELQGFFAFSDKPNDAKTISELKEKVKFLVEDAPALAISINTEAPIIKYNISEDYRLSKNGGAKGFTPLVNAGKDLTRVPVVEIEFGKDEGRMIVSQLITSGRLLKENNEEGIDKLRYDPVAVQFVLNMIKRLENE